MANTQNYINHLLQNTGITPACSEEERLAAEDIAQIFRNHGFDPEVQEFNAPAPSRLAFAVTGILAFAGALLMGIGGGIGLVGTLLAIVGAVLYVLELTGHPVVSRLGKTGVSQNVIAYHRASGPLASPRNRPVVVVAHYDSPRAELLAREPYASYRALIAKLLPVATVAPAVVAILRILPLPGALKVLLWIVAILASLVALANAANIISNRCILPYTSGAVCNKSSVAAMLGVMDNVAPFQGENEFPDDVPFDTYLGSRSVVPRRWRAQQRSMPRPNSKTTTATPSSMKSLPTPRTSSVSRLLPTLRPSPNRVRISTSRSRALRVRLPTRR